MNIIKLYDKIMPEECEPSRFFNSQLKGKYAYAIHMRYIVPLENMDYDMYVLCEKDINKLLLQDDGAYPTPHACEFIDLYSKSAEKANIFEYIDYEETNKINDIKPFILKNTYVTDNDITLDDIKRFRTWLAIELLSLGKYLNGIYNSQEEHVLKYYANNMVDDTINSLMDFGSSTFKTDSVTKSCGCYGSSNIDSLYNIDICDPISIYKKNIYMKMVEMFSNIDFWAQLPKEFILTFKHYIKNIIQICLPLKKSLYTKYECICFADDNFEEDYDMLKKLLVSLEYIYNEDVVGHKNYIKDSFNKWASYLYEDMEW